MSVLVKCIFLSPPCIVIDIKSCKICYSLKYNLLISCNVSGSDETDVSEGSTVQPCEDQKPPVFSNKKEPPSYPPGEMESLSFLLSVN